MSVPAKTPQRPEQDKRHPLLRPSQSGNRVLTAVEDDLALQVCEQVALGMTLEKVCAKENEGRFPSYLTFVRWMLMHPRVKMAYEAALELRTFAMEDEAIEAARASVSKPSSVPGVRVLLNQLQWSMERGNAQRFGQKGVGTVTVPIQINTTMNLGQDGAASKGGAKSVYEVTANVPQYVDFDDVPETPTEGVGGKRKSHGPQKRVLTPRVLPDGSENPDFAAERHAANSARAHNAAAARWKKEDENGTS